MLIQKSLAVFFATMLLMVNNLRAQAATFDIPPGDTAALVAAIQAASDTPATADVINLASGSTYNLTFVNNSYLHTGHIFGAFGGENGLPVIHGSITINGNGATIKRADAAPDFRLLFVDSDGSLTLNNLTLQRGRATNSVDAHANQGGGIANLGTLTMNDSLLTHNFARAGGGILNFGGSTSINRSSISDNVVEITGGGIWSYQPLVIIDSTVSGNTIQTNGDGAGIAIYGESVTVQNSTISGNTIAVGGTGGGIYMVGGTDWLIEISTNSTISGNSAAQGGGIYNATGRFSVRNVTIANNSASQAGGGIYNMDTEGTEEDNTLFNFANAILDDNLPTNCNPNGPFASSGNNIDSDGSCNLQGEGDQSGINPQLGLLADNGGPTETHALLAGSPAINHANPNNCPLFDQRGVLRGAACDIGAFEYIPEYIPSDLAPTIHLYPTAHPRLTWTPITWARGYEVEVADNNRFQSPAFHDDSVPADVLSVIVTTQLDNKVWYWHVRAKQPDGEWGDWSRTETFIVNVVSTS